MMYLKTFKLSDERNTIKTTDIAMAYGILNSQSDYENKII